MLNEYGMIISGYDISLFNSELTLNYRFTYLIIGAIGSALLYLVFTRIYPNELFHFGEKVFESTSIGLMLSIAALMAFWWITEAVSIYVTAMLPIALFPIFGIMSIKEVAPLYMKDIIFLFMGGFMMAYAVERWNLHKRIASYIVMRLGSSSSGLLLGIMVAGYFLSMWILNTAVATLLLPAVLAVTNGSSANENQSRLTIPLLLGLAYSCSIGGMATLIGTLPNLCTMEFYNEHIIGSEINFANWFAVGMPTSFMMLVACYLVIKFLYRQSLSSIDENWNLKQINKKLGPIGYEEQIILIICTLTVLLWFTRKDIDFGLFYFHGWSGLLPAADYMKESSVAMLAAIAMFLIPAKNEKGAILRWEDTTRLPLGILFLFGGGFALAKGLEISGVSLWMGAQLNLISDLSPFIVVLCLCGFMIFFTELTSNTASVLILLPVILELSKVINLHPAQLFIPVTLAASCAFMLPVATPPNTIVYASERLPGKEMFRSGFIMNMIGTLILSTSTYFLVSLFLGTTK